MAKYSKRFAKELENGLRRNGRSIDACCIHWGVSRQAYVNWKELHPEFARAAELGERDYRAYIHDEALAVATGLKKGNARLLGLFCQSILGMSTKSESVVTQTEQVKTLNINVKRPVIIDIPEIEHKDEELIKANVLEFVNVKDE